MTRSTTTWRLWKPLFGAPTMAARERSVATALLLVLMVGSAHARAVAAWAPVLPSSAPAAAAEVPLPRVAHRPARDTDARPPATRPAAPVCRCRSVARRELPPPRAPDLVRIRLCAG